MKETGALCKSERTCTISLREIKEFFFFIQVLSENT